MPLSMTCGATGACTSFSQHAHPLAADVALDGEHAGLVVQLLGHVLADALHGLAAAAGGVLGLVADVAARQVRRQLRLGCCFSPAAGAGCSASISAATPPGLSSVSSSRLFCSALKRSLLAANFSRLSMAFSCVSLSMTACLKALGARRAASRSCWASSVSSESAAITSGMCRQSLRHRQMPQWTRPTAA
jgi:hypothetical protein